MTDTTRRVAICTPLAPLHTEPSVASDQRSQLLAGRVADVIDVSGDWLLVRGPDAYDGWIHRGYVATAPDEGTRRSIAVERISLGCITTSPSGARRSMPLGAFLSAEERVKSGEVLLPSQRQELFPAEAGAVTRSAQLFFEGTSYLWGGVTPWGADCSGLVQSTYWLHGVQLRRDAHLQAEQGAAGDTDPLNARTGDLLFFSDRADRFITHVGLALGMRAMVHVAIGRGGYSVERLDDDRDAYVRTLLERFVTARRILGPD